MSEEPKATYDTATETVTLRLSVDAHLMLHQSASSRGLSVADYLIDLHEAELEREGKPKLKWIGPPPSEDHPVVSGKSGVVDMRDASRRQNDPREV